MKFNTPAFLNDAESIGHSGIDPMAVAAFKKALH